MSTRGPQRPNTESPDTVLIDTTRARRIAAYRRHRRSPAWLIRGMSIGLILLLALVVMWVIPKRPKITSTELSGNRSEPEQQVETAPTEVYSTPTLRPSRTPNAPTSARQSPDKTPAISSTDANQLKSRTISGKPRTASVPSNDTNGETLASSHHRTFESPLPIHGHNSIDDIVFMSLFEAQIKPSKGCSDAVFLRRAYIDATGTIPTAEEAEAFLKDFGDDKRNRLVDDLLDRDAYADYWAMRWCDVLRVKAEFPINLWPNAAHAYYRWIHSAIADEMPYDQFARELLTASGSNFRKPQVNFYRAIQSKSPEEIAKTVALTFMATRAEKWPANRLEAMSKFFSKVGYKPTGEWKEEIIFFDRHGAYTSEAPTKSIRASRPIPATGIDTFYPSGASVVIPPGRDPREVFADWMVHPENPWFSRAVANRIWYWLMGYGIVNPVDDVSSENAASNLALMNHLAAVLIEEKFNLKELVRRIMKSSAYQLSSIPASDHDNAKELFAFYSIRRHDAEVLIDAINQITDTTETYMSIVPEPFTWLPSDQKAVAIPDGSITSSFLELFGRPARDTGMANERDNKLTARQALHLLNSNHIRDKLKTGRGLQRLFDNTINSTQLAEQVYLTVLSRMPSEKELYQANMMCSDSNGMRELTWALINSDEFLFQH